LVGELTRHGKRENDVQAMRDLTTTKSHIHAFGTPNDKGAAAAAEAAGAAGGAAAAGGGEAEAGGKEGGAGGEEKTKGVVSFLYDQHVM
jgi:hypothetical protein